MQPASRTAPSPAPPRTSRRSRAGRPVRGATLRLGTRRSPLALAQSGLVARALEDRHPGLAVELVQVVTTGDITPGDLASAGGKGLFTLELERGLLDGSLDLAVHSLKDLPVTLPEGLEVAAYPLREDPRDVLISELAEDLDGLPDGAVVLTASLRRRAQLLLHRSDLQVEPVRGNVDTRLRRWHERHAAGLILASAGLSRLGLLERGELPVHPLPPEVLLPAPGQGTLALEVKSGSDAAMFCRPLNHLPTAVSAIAERLVVAAFGSDCTMPLAAWARQEGGSLRLSAMLVTPDGLVAARGEASGQSAKEVAAACVAALHANGAGKVMELLRAHPHPAGVQG